eukprot:jgi/Bigna1/87610/estExt_fgenesh1_pg.C_220090
MEQEKRRIGELLGDHLSGKKKRTHHHPIFNFIFEYYMFKPKMLLQYSPGIGVLLEGATEGDESLPRRGFSFSEDGEEEVEGETRQQHIAWAEPLLAKPKTVESLRWTRDLLKATLEKKPELHCYGMHEWAMLYYPQDSMHEAPRKYQSLPLRISQETINSAVEAEPIRCTHFDAFRFYAKDATEKNVNQLTRQTQPEFEQPGCLHANMDLFKWSIKLFPWVSSQLLHDSLSIATRARAIDIRASPYAAEGAVDDFELSPIPIETHEGRAQYKTLQAELWKDAIPIRKRLIEAYDAFLEHHNELSC